MFIDIDSMFETYEVAFETYLEDKMVNKQTMQAPKQIIMANFVQLMNQVGNDKRPIKIRLTRQETILDDFKKEKVLEHEVAFSNNAMVSWEENDNN